MSEKSNQTKAETGSKKSEKKEARYSRQEVITNAKAAFGVSPEVVSGALNSSTKDTFTKSEVKTAVQKFLKRKV